MIFPSTLITGTNDTLIDQEVSNICQELKTDPAPTNPDVLIINTDYSIDQIRSLRNFLSQKPFSRSYKVVIVYSADQLHTEAQNSLLKMLEEPGKNNYLILTSHQPHSLLPTIISRCHHIITRPSSAQPSANLLKISPDPKTNFATIDQIILGHDRQFVLNLLRQQIQLYQKLLTKQPSPQNANVIKKLITATTMLHANVDPRSALDYFFLS